MHDPEINDSHETVNVSLEILLFLMHFNHKTLIKESVGFPLILVRVQEPRVNLSCLHLGKPVETILPLKGSSTIIQFLTFKYIFLWLKFI